MTEISMDIYTCIRCTDKDFLGVANMAKGYRENGINFIGKLVKLLGNT